ncbi:mitochondrial import protein Pam17 [Dipodascopsis tothii]|uniref:mitochondrial import protein Pam17 n=1 Tax=Dipodascopsis tothii TaxID=44089 RepID=UPI0034D000CC
MLRLSVSSPLHRPLLWPIGVPVRAFSASARARVDEPAAPTLTWNDFLSLRQTRRRLQLSSSIFTGFLGISTGWGYLSSIEIDPTQMIFGFDPFIVLGGALAGCAALGALAGPSAGDLVFKYLTLRGRRHIFEDKNNTFLQHIKRNRVDPSYQSFSNPVPDYYGEKITSLHGYRRWLRDCAAYRKKRENFL